MADARLLGTILGGAAVGDPRLRRPIVRGYRSFTKAVSSFRRLRILGSVVSAETPGALERLRLAAAVRDHAIAITR